MNKARRGRHFGSAIVDFDIVCKMGDNGHGHGNGNHGMEWNARIVDRVSDSSI